MGEIFVKILNMGLTPILSTQRRGYIRGDT